MSRWAKFGVSPGASTTVPPDPVRYDKQEGIKPLKQVRYELERPTFVQSMFVLTTVPGTLFSRGTRFEYLTGRSEGPGAKDVFLMIQYHEILRAPSICLEVLGEEEPGLFPQKVEDINVKNNIKELAQRAMRGALMSWKLWRIELGSCGEIWLEFVNEMNGDFERWNLAEKDTREPLTELKIWMPDGRFFEYRYYKIAETVLLKEYTADNRTQIRQIDINDKGKIFVTEM